MDGLTDGSPVAFPGAYFFAGAFSWASMIF